jgi:hypothetical protein
MTGLTVERRPGRVVFVTGLLGHRAVVESMAELLVDPDALDLALKVAAAGRACQEDPSEAADDAYAEAMNALAAHLNSTTFMFHDWDLEGIAAVVNERRAVSV